MLGPVPVEDLPLVIGVCGLLQEILHQVYGVVQVVIIHIPAIDMDLSPELGAQVFPVPLQDIAQIIIFPPVRGHLRVYLPGFLVPDPLGVSIRSLGGIGGFPDVPLLPGPALVAKGQLQLVIFPDCGLYMPEVIPVGRHLQGLMGTGIPVGILVFVYVSKAIGPEIDGVRAGRKAAVVLLRVFHLYGQGFPAPGGPPVEETGPPLPDTAEFFLDIRDKLMGDRIPVRPLTGGIHRIGIVVIGRGVLDLYDQKTGKLGGGPPFVEIVGLLLLDDVIPFNVKALRVFRFHVFVWRFGAKPPEIRGKMPVEHHQGVARLRVFLKPFRQQDMGPEVHVPPPEFGETL